MPTTEDAQPIEPPAESATREPTALRPPAPEDLSPAVRRLVRQFSLDVTGIHGSGPSGRIRIGDVIGLLDGRTDTGNRDAPLRITPGESADEDPPLPRAAAEALVPHEKHAAAAAAAAGPTTAVFDCDLTRVRAHRRKQRSAGRDLSLLSYFLVAFKDAISAVPELAAGHAGTLGVLLYPADGAPRSVAIRPSAIGSEAPLVERLAATDAALRGAAPDTRAADVLVHYYGDSGSLICTPTPIGVGHAGSLGIGRMRREITVRMVNGADTPRVTARCYVSLSFLTERLEFHRANRFLAHAIRLLEHWPK